MKGVCCVEDGQSSPTVSAESTGGGAGCAAESCGKKTKCEHLTII